MSFNVDANEVYDLPTNKWAVLEPMPSKRGGLSSAVVNGYIYVFGGEQPDGTFNKKHDVISNKWTSEKSMPAAPTMTAILSFCLSSSFSFLDLAVLPPLT